MFPLDQRNRTSSACLALLALLLASATLAHAEPNAATRDLPQLIEQLGAVDDQDREAAMVALLTLGPQIHDQLNAAMLASDDPEVRRRLRYVIEHVTPPRAGFIVLNISATEMVRPGDIITQFDGRRVSERATLDEMLSIGDRDITVSLWTPSGPRTERIAYAANLHAYLPYDDVTGEALAALVREFANGFPERAQERLTNTPSLRWSPLITPEFRILLAYTIGKRYPELAEVLASADQAARLIQPRVNYASPLPGTMWDLPAAIDIAGPSEAPYQLEWELWEKAGPRSFSAENDPDLRVQRVQVPANRHIDALVTCAKLWWTRYHNRDLTMPNNNIVQAGNMLAVVSWMAFELDLLSECSHLIEPRSRVLRRSRNTINKWLRVHTDAWLPYLQGDAKGALDYYYEDALKILEHPLRPGDLAVLTQNPAVAGRIAFFLYQFPNDPRVATTLETVNNPHQSARFDYAWWMCLALRTGNYDVIREHLGQLTPNLPSKTVPRFARGMALLEYIAENPTPATFANAAELVSQHAEPAEKATLLAEVQTLRHLAAGEIDAAEESVAKAKDALGGSVLGETVAFRKWLSAATFNTLSDRPPLIAVPADPNRDAWLVLTRERQLMRYDQKKDQLQPLPDVPATWFPGVLNWPWVGFEPTTGRTWVYAPREVHELDNIETPVSVSLHTDDIAEFDRAVRPVFSTFAQALATGRPLEECDGAYLNEDVSNPLAPIAPADRPEICELTRLPGDPRLVHLATRNGVHCLIDTTAAQACTNGEIAAAINVDGFEWLMPIAVRKHETPLVYLMTDKGLIEVDLASEAIRRHKLPDAPAESPVIAENLPFERRDPRYIYFAAPPLAGNQLYRLDRETDTITKLETLNFGLTRSFYRQRSRAWLRDEIDQRLYNAGLPKLAEFIHIAEQETKALEQPGNAP